MQIYADKLAGQLKQGISPLYLVAGDDLLLRDDACEQIRSAAQSSGYDACERHFQDQQFSWTSWLDSCNSLSLFGDKRLIELRLQSAKIGLEGAKAVNAYLERPATDAVLLIIAPRVEGKPKWLSNFIAQGVYIPIYPLDQTKLPSWLIQRAAGKNLKLDRDAAQLLAERVTGNLMAAVQELEKLALSHSADSDGASRITIGEIEKSVSDSAQFSAFNMLDYAIDGNAALACRALRHLLEEGTEIPALLGAVAHQLRNLSQLKSFQDNNQLDAGFKSTRIFAKRQPAFKKALQRLTAAQIDQCIMLASKADIMSKSGQRAASLSAIEMVVFSLAGHALPTQKIFLQRAI